MSDAPLIDYIEQQAARARAEAGGARAADKAERVEPGWREQALETLQRHALTHQRFLIEHIGISIPSSADPRACGSIVREAARRGWIRKDGYAPACTSNGSPKCVWASLIYGGTA